MRQRLALMRLSAVAIPIAPKRRRNRAAIGGRARSTPGNKPVFFIITGAWGLMEGQKRFKGLQVLG
jgi:hypothetical protein